VAVPGPIFGTGLLAGLRQRFPNLARPKHPRRMKVQTYIRRHYAAVPGFSSVLSAQVAARLLACQQDFGIQGPVGEIGVMLGRSFIVLALAAEPTDRCLAIDDFAWPSDARAKFLRNCTRFGIDPDQVPIIASKSTSLAPADILAYLAGAKLRYLHIDGGHTTDVLLHDLGIARTIMMPDGILCLDDMLHAQYPDLGLTVHDHLTRNPDLTVFCIVDRSDLIAASKYLICRRDFAARYQQDLRSAFPDHVFPDPAEFSTGPALILSRDAGLVPVYRKMIERFG
jgi:hypothetical protein